MVGDRYAFGTNSGYLFPVRIIPMSGKDLMRRTAYPVLLDAEVVAELFEGISLSSANLQSLAESDLASSFSSSTRTRCGPSPVRTLEAASWPGISESAERNGFRFFRFVGDTNRGLDGSGSDDRLVDVGENTDGDAGECQVVPT